jgi:N-methylhydantoinase B
MKFSQNGFYIESYTKCANCGVLVYESVAEDQANKVELDGATYCSQWCVDWKAARDARKGVPA